MSEHVERVNDAQHGATPSPKPTTDARSRAMALMFGGGRRAETEKLTAHVDVLRQRAIRLRKQTRDDESAAAAATQVDGLLKQLDDDSWKVGGETAHAYADMLEELIPLIAPREYLDAELCQERASPPGQDGDVRELLVPHLLDRGRPAGAHEGAAVLPDPVLAETLSRLHQLRCGQLRHDRLMARHRRAALPALAALLATFLLVAGVAILAGQSPTGSDHATWAELVTVASLGGLGGTLSATLKLRDIVELNSFRGVLGFVYMQPLVGAAFGVVSWLLLSSGLLTVGGPDGTWYTSAVVAFASGFSEPFVLGILSKSLGPPK